MVVTVLFTMVLMFRVRFKRKPALIAQATPAGEGRDELVTGQERQWTLEVIESLAV